MSPAGVCAPGRLHLGFHLEPGVTALLLTITTGDYSVLMLHASFIQQVYNSRHKCVHLQLNDKNRDVLMADHFAACLSNHCKIYSFTNFIFLMNR